MTILFLCGSLEPGKDGVGDYTRRLAGELIRQGHQASIIALNDRHCETQIENTQECDGTSIEVLRLPSVVLSKERFYQASLFIEKQNPEWLSLQYVPYSFHNKGLPFGLSKQLAKIGKGRKWHIMFHELWIGLTKMSPLKHKIIGFPQRKIANNLVSNINPKLITTSNKLYEILLKNNKIDSEILRLFSNIPKTTEDIDFQDYLYKKLIVPEIGRNNLILAGIFGTIHSSSNLEIVIKDLEQQAYLQQKRLGIVIIGRIGTYGEIEIERLKAIFSARVIFVVLGEQNPQQVSTFLQMMDYGISSTPTQFIGKSGVYAAMRYHNLNIIMSNNNNIIDCIANLDEYLSDLINIPSENWSTEYICKKLINRLSLTK